MKKPSKRLQNGRSLGGNIALFLALLTMGAFTALPLVFIAGNAFKPIDELFVYPPRLLPRNPSTENFKSMFQIMSQSWVPFGRYIFNTVFLTVTGTAGHLFLASMAAFVLAKHRFPGQRILFQTVVLSLMFTPAVTGVSNYIIMSALGIVDTYLAALLPALQMTLGLYLMKQFMETLPDSVLESARIDGAGEMLIFRRIAMPMVKPAWITLIVLTVISLWGSSTPLVYSEELKSMSQAMGQILAGGIIRTGAGAASALFMLSVPLVLFIFSQSRIIETMNSSGMKE